MPMQLTHFYGRQVWPSRTEAVTGIVDSTRAGRARVRVDSAIACARCAAGKGCGAGMFQGDKTTHIDVAIPDGIAINSGDTVSLAIGTQQVLRAALIAYALPLGCVLLALGIAQFWLDELQDGHALLAALVGLVSGLAIGRRLLRGERACRRFRPILVGAGGNGRE